MLWLRDIIRERGYTVKTLATAMGIAPSTITQWIQGTFEPRATNIRQMCLLLQVSSDELLNIDGARQMTLPKPLAVDLYRTVTMRGSLDSGSFHNWATRLKVQRGGKITREEVWLREIAEVCYSIEISKRPHRRRKKLFNDVKRARQLDLFKDV